MFSSGSDKNDQQVSQLLHEAQIQSLKYMAIVTAKHRASVTDSGQLPNTGDAKVISFAIQKLKQVSSSRNPDQESIQSAISELKETMKMANKQIKEFDKSAPPLESLVPKKPQSGAAAISDVEQKNLESCYLQYKIYNQFYEKFSNAKDKNLALNELWKELAEFGKRAGVTIQREPGSKSFDDLIKALKTNFVPIQTSLTNPQQATAQAQAQPKLTLQSALENCDKLRDSKDKKAYGKAVDDLARVLAMSSTQVGGLRSALKPEAKDDLEKRIKENPRHLEFVKAAYLASDVLPPFKDSGLSAAQQPEAKSTSTAAVTSAITKADSTAAKLSTTTAPPPPPIPKSMPSLDEKSWGEQRIETQKKQIKRLPEEEQTFRTPLKIGSRGPAPGKGPT